MSNFEKLKPEVETGIFYQFQHLKYIIYHIFEGRFLNIAGVVVYYFLIIKTHTFFALFDLACG